MRLAIFAAAAAAFAAAPAAAQPVLSDAAGGVEGPVIEDVRINQLILYGDDACPPSTDEEIIVCARRPEDDRFRIPENLRRNPNDPAHRTWTDRAIDLSYVGRTGIQSCTPVGPGGATGCFQQLADRYRAERQTRDEVNWNRLIEEARQERLSRIDAQAEAEEQASQPQ